MIKNEKLKQDRINEIIEIIMKVAQGDYSVQIEPSDKNDEIDSLIKGFNMMIDDIRETHAALKKNEEHLRSTFSSLDDLVFVLDKRGIFRDYYQPPARADLYVPPEQFLGKSYKEVPLPPEVIKAYDTAIKTVEMTGMVQQVDYSLEINGEKRWYIARVSMRKNSSGEFDGVTACARDITERKRIENEILLTNTILETQKETSIDGILVVDDQGRVVSHNKRFAQMWSISDELLAAKEDDKLLSFVFSQLENPDKFIKKVEYLYAHKQEKSRDEILFKDGKVFDRYSAPLISPSGQYFGRVWFFRDITDAKRMQELLVRQEKLAVLGELAGGVGHELRNPLGVIKNAAYFLKMTLENPDPEVKEILEILDKEVFSAEKIISSLLDFARPNPPIQRRTNINQPLKKALSHINVTENIEIIYPFVESLPNIPADPDQIGQVFENILLNAVQAMPEGGQLIIKTEAPNPGWVTVSITDTGIGIPGENLAKVFEPLFTTKAKGIGLGMAIAKTFVEGHGGRIDINSQPGKGSTFTVRLPVHEQERKKKEN